MKELLEMQLFETLPTLNQFVDRSDDIDEIKGYKSMLNEIPKRSDFLCFDCDGFALNDHTPMFEGWEVCEETSNENIQVAKLIDETGEYRIYFGTKDGVIIVSQTNMCDNATYNDLAIFFEGKLKLS